jgi:hypothetical protein
MHGRSGPFWDGVQGGEHGATDERRAGASVHDWRLSGKSDAEAERFERDHSVSGSRLTLQKPMR